MRSISSKAALPSCSRITSPRMRPSSRMSSTSGRFFVGARRRLARAARAARWRVGVARALGRHEWLQRFRACNNRVVAGRRRRAARLRRRWQARAPAIMHRTMPETIIIATRESRLALWQAEHVRDLLQAALRPAGRAARHDHARRPDPRPRAVQGRRQGPVRQGAGNGARRRPRRPRRAFAEGRADGPAAPASCSPRCWSAKTRAMPSSRPRYAALAELPQGAVRRHLQPAPRRCSCWRCGPTCASSRCAATSTRGCASSTKASYDAIVLAAAGLKRLGLAARIRARVRAGADAAGGRAGRAGHRGARRRARRCARAWPRWSHRPTWLAVQAERAVSRALGGSCSMPLAAHAVWQGDTLCSTRRSAMRRSWRGRCCARSCSARVAQRAEARGAGRARRGAAARRAVPTATWAPPPEAACEARARVRVIVTRPRRRPSWVRDCGRRHRRGGACR